MRLRTTRRTGRHGKHEDTQNINGGVMYPIHTSSLEKDRMIEMKCKNQCNVCLTLRSSTLILDHTGLWIHQSFHRTARTNVQIDRVHDHVKHKVRSFESICDDDMCKIYAHHLNQYDDDYLCECFYVRVKISFRSVICVFDCMLEVRSLS